MTILRKNLDYSPIFCEESLPASVVNLTVVRLDGTAFEISVLDGATVSDLKAALEISLNHELRKMEHCASIDWDQVWTNFCLCYMNHKLLDDSATLRSIGIQRDDQIKFVCHRSSHSNQGKRWRLIGGCFAPH